MSLDVEMRITDIVERYRTLEMYKIEVSDEEKETCRNFKLMWDDLFLESKHVDASLIVVKKKFTEVGIIIIIIITVFITCLLPKDTKRQVLLLQGVGRILRYKTYSLSTM